MSTKKFTNVQVAEIHARLMLALDLSSKTELAKRLAISIQTLKNRESRGVNSMADVELLCNKERLKREWVFSGIGEAKIIFPIKDPRVLLVAEPEISIHPDVVLKINQLLAQMSEEQQRDVLKYAEEKKLLSELMEERKKAG